MTARGDLVTVDDPVVGTGPPAGALPAAVDDARLGAARRAATRRAQRRGLGRAAVGGRVRGCPRRRCRLMPHWGLTLHTALVASLGLTTLSAGLRLVRRRWGAIASAAAWEAALVCVIFALWQVVGGLARTRVTGGISHGYAVWHAERWAHLPSEASLQHVVIPHHLVVKFCNLFYAGAHLNSMWMFLVWVFVRHRDQYARWRNVVVLSTGMCLLVQMIPVAPPRFLLDIGVVDTPLRTASRCMAPSIVASPTSCRRCPRCTSAGPCSSPTPSSRRVVAVGAGWCSCMLRSRSSPSSSPPTTSGWTASLLRRWSSSRYTSNAGWRSLPNSDRSGAREAHDRVIVGADLVDELSAPLMTMPAAPSSPFVVSVQLDGLLAVSPMQPSAVRSPLVIRVNTTMASSPTLPT